MKSDMKLNTNKTKAMVITRKEKKMNTTIDVKIEQIRQLQYLGVIIEERGRKKFEINTRIKKAITRL